MGGGGAAGEAAETADHGDVGSLKVGQPQEATRTARESRARTFQCHGVNVMVRVSRAELEAAGVRIRQGTSVRVLTEELGTGPWSAAFAVALCVTIRSKSNFRRRQARGQQWSQVREFEAQVSAALRQAVPAEWPEDSLEVAFAERHGVVGVCYARAVLDTPNLGKSIYDAAEGILYANDAQVRAETSMVERGRSRPVLVAGFAAVSPGAGVAECRAATEGLFGAVERLRARVDAEELCEEEE